MTESAPTGDQRDHGPQPIDALMERLCLANNELVAASTEQLTHKQVQKARKGRRVTRNIQKKIKNALERILLEKGEERRFALDELFNYVS
ncbi:MAG: hypothetical protein P1U58_05950 [Verrucomicrobiales bacterium]|nr:hypothetical protein [Verrucomicrobiales bacterium]